ncbi:hypothetical protein [Chenggangzhangella methanolivorans]|uniref:Uncharacterized protein n=1 Tax=Chenggangzhangella methanolivorans TaxID=1437009 RepID=A0A9E6R900_9HYPH|nr:hypothetical protein [Chenggangzhangella methanolivorans]QZN99519.1 hypothetical protein K6K41_22865 [Chenggangzhangella methanolivorans]
MTTRNSNGALERSPETAARTGMGIASLAAVAPAALAPLNGAQAPAPEAAAGQGLGAPGFSPVQPSELAPLLRGEARACDGAALVLARRLGLPPLGVLAALPQARALARQNARALARQTAGA